jgi:cytochrome c oxidase subunit I+III
MSEPIEQPSQGATALRLHRELAAIWGTGPGLQRLAAVNHSIIGMRMMITSFVFFAIAGVLGMLTACSSLRRRGTSWTPRPTTRSSPCTGR